MELSSIHAQHRKQIFLAISGLGLFIMAGFTVVHYIESNAFSMWVTIAMALLTAGAIIALQRGAEDRNVYRFVCGIIGIGLFSIAAFGPNHLYYHAALPLVMFCFLGHREGLIWSAVFFIVMASLLFGVELPDPHTQETDHVVRFLSCYLFISMVAWSYEELQRRFYGVLETQNEQLQEDKEQLGATLNRVRETERQLEQTNIELQDKTQLMQTVFNSMSEGVIVADATGRQLLFNPSAEQISGKGMTSFEPGKWAEIYGLFYPDNKAFIPMDQNPLVRATRGESVDGFEIFVRNENRPEGIYVSATGRPIRNQKTNEITAGVVVFRDVTQQKKTEARLKQTISELQDKTQLMETVFNSMQEGLLLVDPEGRQLFHNPSAEQICGMGMTPSQPGEWAETYGIFYPDKKTHVPVDQNPLVRAMQGESVDDFESFVRNEERPEGIYVTATGRPIRDQETNEIKAGVVVFRDITQQKKAEAQLEQTIGELRDQSQLMEAMFNSVSDGVVVTDTDGGFLFVNPSAKRIVGMGPTDGPSDQWSETYGTFYPDGKTLFPSTELPLARAMRGQAVDDVELLIRNQERPDGVYISVNGRPLQDGAGTLKGGMIVLRDVTKLKKAETELKQTVRSLQEQTRLMETVFNSISDGVIAADESGKHLVFNRSARNIADISARDVEPAQRPEKYGLFRPDGKALFPAAELPLMRAIRGEATDEVEMFIRNSKVPKGIYTRVSGRPLQDETGSVKGGVVVLRDVTAIKEAENRLQQTADRLQAQTQAMETVFNSISDGVVAADENGKFTIFNPSAERIVGIGATDKDPDQWSDRYGLFFPDRVTPFPTEELPLVLAIQGESSDEVEMFVRNPRIPEGVYISVSGRPLRDDSGTAQGGVIVFRDVTERTLAEEALTQAFSQGRLEIVDTILHNIGNAINSVAIGVGTVHEQLTKNASLRRLSVLAKAIEAHRDDWISYLQRDPQGQKVMPFILALADDFAKQNEQLKQTIERVDDRVAHIVDIIRTQRSFESETMTRKQVNLRKAVADAVKVLQGSIAKRGVRIQIDCQNAPKEIRIQESKFNQMLVNLIKNAVEAIDDLAHSNGLQEQPCIQIRAYVEEDFLVLDVIDNGIGIETKISKLIFSAGYTTKRTGSGLGLHSTANFVIGSGGKIQPLSDGLGKGTTMRVKLRLSSVVLQSTSETPARGVSPQPTTRR